MSPAAPSSEPLTPAELAQDARFYRDTLNTFIEIGTELATAIHKEVVALASGPGSLAKRRDLVADFDRIARTVRRSILLVMALHRPPRPLTTAKPATRTCEDPAETPDTDRPETCPEERPERLDRLDAPEHADDITARPIAAIVAEIARDLGVPVPLRPTAAATTGAPAPPSLPSWPGALASTTVATLSHTPTRRPDG